MRSSSKHFIVVALSRTATFIGDHANLPVLAICVASHLVLLPTGCTAVQKIREIRANIAAWREEAVDSPVTSLVAKKPSNAAVKVEPPDANAAAKILASDEWGLALPVASTAGPLEGYRWQHPKLEALLNGTAANPPDLQAALTDADRVTSANAAIYLARRGDHAAVPRLVETIKASTLRIQLRQAAADTLATLNNPAPLTELQHLLDEYGQLPPDNKNYVPLLHAELLRGMSRHISAADEPQFTTALRSPSADVRREALAAWSICTTASLPQAAVDLRTDPNSRIRSDAIGAIVAHRHPQALEFAQASLADYQVEVRQAAMVALGKLGGPESQKLLEKFLANQPDLIRANALAALSELGARDKVESFASDPSWRIRQTVAKSLSRYPDAAGSELARKLVKDNSTEVQKQMVASLEKWPLEAAGPVLLATLESTHFQPRKMAAEQLSRRWPAGGNYSVDAPVERRAEMLVSLQRLWSQQFGTSNVIVASHNASITNADVNQPLTPARIEAARQLVARLTSGAGPATARTEAIQELVSYGRTLEPALTAIVGTSGQVLPEIIYCEVLPRTSPAFVALDRLSSTNVDERRRAADRLRELASQAPLSGLALARMAEIGIRETDGLVWRSLLMVIAAQTSEPAFRLTYAALSHPSPEIRRMACEYLGAHPHASHATALLPALADESPSVMYAAVRALGHPGVLDDPRPLEQMLATSNKSLRIEVASSLVKLGAPSGPPALERLAYDGDAEIRRRAAATMGQNPNPAYTATLIHLLDDMLGVQQAAVNSLPAVVGADMSRTAGDPPENFAEQISRWKKWWSQQ